MNAQAPSGLAPISLIEDEPSVTAFLRAALERHGYAVANAATGAEGLSMLRPSAPVAALATAYPWRSSAARRKAVTEGSSSMSEMGASPEGACAFIALPLLQARRPRWRHSLPE